MGKQAIHTLWSRQGVPWVLALFALILAWTGGLDHSALGYLKESMIGSGAIYATARSINALVSVLQGTEIDIVFVSFSVGEMLDPVNDLIERFSAAMLFALGSLALQQLLLNIVSHPYISVALTLVVASAFVIWLSGSERARELSVRVVLIALLIRLLLPIVVFVTIAIESVFLREAEQNRLEQVQEFEGQLRAVEDELGLSANLDRELAQLDLSRATTQELRDATALRIAHLDRQLREAQAEQDALPDHSFWDSLTGKEKAAELLAVESIIDEFERSIRREKATLASLDDEIASIDERKHCVELRRQGSPCSIFEGISKVARKADLRPQLNAIAGRVDAFSTNLIELLTILLFKSILLPLASLWVASRLAMALVQRLQL